MNIKVLEAIYKEDFKQLDTYYKSNTIHPDLSINDVKFILLLYLTLVRNDSFTFNMFNNL